MAIIDTDFWLVRRKFGGFCGAFCRGSPYLRRKPVPLLPRREKQMSRRALWGWLTRQWANELEEWERDDWDEAAEDWLIYRDDQEQARHLVGFEWFCTLGARAVLAGLPYVRWADVGISFTLTTFSVAILDEWTIRLTFTPDSGSDSGLVVYGRIGTSKGDMREVPDYTWQVHAVPAGWRWFGFGGLGSSSPVDLTLPAPVSSGQKVIVIGQEMDYSGYLNQEWLRASAVAA